MLLSAHLQCRLTACSLISCFRPLSIFHFVIYVILYPNLFTHLIITRKVSLSTNCYTKF
nr:MAG TPA: hypothetical protein [Caudoviricetes sp.]